MCSNQNNIEEAFNELENVLKTREKPIYSLLEDIKVHMIRRLHEKRLFGESWKNDIGPLVKHKLMRQ